jgi:hypothetical protein
MRLPIIIASLFLTTSALAQDGSPGCDMSSFDNAVETCKQTQLIALEGFVRQPAVTPAVTAAGETALSKVNKATTAPDAFAARIHNSYQDFLNPFSFAINKVEESKDGQALIARFNPLRALGVNLGFTATAAKPVLLDDLKKAIPDASRDDTVAALEKKLGDFDDVTVAASATYVSDCGPERAGRCFGRNPRQYRAFLSPLLFQPSLIALASSGEAQDLSDKLRAEAKRRGFAISTKFGDVPEADQRAIFALATSAGRADLADTKRYLSEFKRLGIDQLSSLIDNQPQLSGTMSYRNVGRLGGPDEYAATVEFQWGRTNLWSVGKCGNGFDACVRKFVADPATSTTLSDKFVVSASYKRSNHYKLADLGDVSVDGFTPVDLPRASELNAKAQWGRRLGVHVGGEQARFDVSGTFVRRNRGGDRKLNRGIATATLTVPYGENMSIPVSVSYANKPEFLTDQRKKLTMHFGISYRFPWEKKPE